MVPHTNEPDPFVLAEHAAVPGERVLAGPDLGAELEVVEPDLLGELAAKRLLDLLVLVDAAAGRRPPHLAGRVAELDEESSSVLVEDERARRLPVDGVEPPLERAEPLEPLGVGNGGVRGRGRGEDEEADVADRPLLGTELGTDAKDAAVGLLADERDRSRAQLERDSLEPLGRAREVGPAEIARTGGRASGGVRQPDPEAESLELLARLERSRCEAGVVEQPPEIVARVREMRPCRG